MDILLMIVFFALFSVVTDRLDKKKRPPQMPQPPQEQLPKQMPAPWPQRPVPVSQEEPLPFKIPELRNAPSSMDDAADLCQEAETIRQQEAESREILEEAHRRERRRAQEPHIRAVRQEACGVQKKALRGGGRLSVNPMIPQLTPESAQQAVVLAEIFGRPKAYRR